MADASFQFVTDETLEPVLDRIEALAAQSGTRLERHRIGASEAGRPLWGLCIGAGPRRVSLTAGAHADEPVGPVTALRIAEFIASEGFGAPSKPDRPDSDASFDSALFDPSIWSRITPADHTFLICPQVNPDGAEANRPWFRDPLDPALYFRHVRREPPERDVEFGYPRPAGRFADSAGRPLPEKPALRPENGAVADFLAPHAPYLFHASLHSMGFAEGVWCLIGERWAVRSRSLQDRLIERTRNLGFGLHDIDRRGEKGFTRIRPGFSTTPRHTAMRDFFLREGDRATAEVFHPNSMEFIQSLGGDPLVMVSEIPLFVIDKPHEWTDPPGDDTPFLQFRRELNRVRSILLGGDEAKAAIALKNLLDEFRLRPAPLQDQVAMQIAMIGEALNFLGKFEPV